MPLGTMHTETGVLLYEGHTLILQRDAGGRWRLDRNSKLDRLAGRRVKLTGIRNGFDWLNVSEVGPI